MARLGPDGPGFMIAILRPRTRTRAVRPWNLASITRVREGDELHRSCSMKSSPASRLFAAALLAATLLPYSGPGICTMVGRMGADSHEMTMTSRSGGPVLDAPGSMTECCSIDGCGVPQAGPAVFTIRLPADHRVREIAPYSAQPSPPQTSPHPPTQPPRA